MKTHFKESFCKMTSQIKLKFNNQDEFIKALRCDLDYLKKGSIEASIPNVATVSSL